MQFRLGKPPPIVDSRTLNFAAYMRPHLPTPPDLIDWGNAVKEWPMYYNDRYGDCTIAAAGHMIQSWTAAAGALKTPSDRAVLEFYEHFVTPGPDAGVYILDALKYWRKSGLDSDKIRAFVAVELRN